MKRRTLYLTDTANDNIDKLSKHTRCSKSEIVTCAINTFYYYSKALSTGDSFHQVRNIKPDLKLNELEILNLQKDLYRFVDGIRDEYGDEIANELSNMFDSFAGILNYSKTALYNQSLERGKWD